jgi:hypothetical protein
VSDTTDPFAGGDKTPSLSFKDAPIGTSYTGRILDAPTLVQSRNFETEQPDFWPDGNPKMSAVVKADFGGETGVRSIWAQKPSALFQAIAEAQTKAGTQIAPGGTITVTYTGDGVRKDGNTKLNPPKQYAVTYAPPNAFAEPAQAAPVAASAAPVAGAPSPEMLAAAAQLLAAQQGTDKPPF